MVSIKRVFRLFTPREVIVMLVFMVVIITSPIALYIQATTDSTELRETQGYTRYIACTIDLRSAAQVAVVPLDQVDKCWDIAEAQVGVKLERYYNLVK